MDFDVLVNGQYRLLLEPIAYMTFGGIKYAMTATEAALYNRQQNGGLRSKSFDKSERYNLYVSIRDGLYHFMKHISQ